MNAVDKIPVRILHVLEANIPQDTGVIKEHIDTAEVLDGSLNDSLAVLNAVVVGDRLAAGSPDLIDNDIRGLTGLANAPTSRNNQVSPLMTFPHRYENRRGRSRRR